MSDSHGRKVGETQSHLLDSRAHVVKLRDRNANLKKSLNTLQDYNDMLTLQCSKMTQEISSQALILSTLQAEMIKERDRNEKLIQQNQDLKRIYKTGEIDLQSLPPGILSSPPFPHHPQESVASAVNPFQSEKLDNSKSTKRIATAGSSIKRPKGFDFSSATKRPKPVAGNASAKVTTTTQYSKTKFKRIEPKEKQALLLQSIQDQENHE